MLWNAVQHSIKPLLCYGTQSSTASPALITKSWKITTRFLNQNNINNTIIIQIWKCNIFFCLNIIKMILTVVALQARTLRHKWWVSPGCLTTHWCPRVMTLPSRSGRSRPRCFRWSHACSLEGFHVFVKGVFML